MLPALRDGPATPPGSDGELRRRRRSRADAEAAGARPSRWRLPLPDAAPARVRLRDHRRLGDCQPPRDRRPGPRAGPRARSAPDVVSSCAGQSWSAGIRRLISSSSTRSPLEHIAGPPHADALDDRQAVADAPRDPRRAERRAEREPGGRVELDHRHRARRLQRRGVELRPRAARRARAAALDRRDHARGVAPRLGLDAAPVIADCSAPSTLKARASSALTTRNTTKPSDDQRVNRWRLRTRGRVKSALAAARGTARPTPPDARGGRRARARARRRDRGSPRRTARGRRRAGTRG